MDTQSRTQWRRRASAFAVWALGLMWTSALVLKLASFNNFLASLGHYGVPQGNLRLGVAILVLGLEALFGLALLFRVRIFVALCGSLALLSIFLVATVTHWSALRDTSCGCFGDWSQGGVRDTIAHQLLAICITGFVLLRADRSFGIRFAPAVAGLASAALIGWFVTSSTLQAQALAEDQVRIIVSASCPHCKADLGQIRVLASAAGGSLPVNIYVGAHDAREIQEFWGAGARPAYISVTFRQISEMTEGVPSVQIIRHGKVAHQWTGSIPSSQEMHRAELEAN